MVDITVGANANQGPNILVKRDGTALSIGAADGSRTRMTAGNNGTTELSGLGATTVVLLDAPATTSSVTYTVEIQNISNATNTVYCNRTESDTDSAQFARTASRVTLIEVAA